MGKTAMIIIDMGAILIGLFFFIVGGIIYATINDSFNGGFYIMLFLGLCLLVSASYDLTVRIK